MLLAIHCIKTNDSSNDDGMFVALNTIHFIDMNILQLFPRRLSFDASFINQKKNRKIERKMFKPHIQFNIICKSKSWSSESTKQIIKLASNKMDGKGIERKEIG